MYNTVVYSIVVPLYNEELVIDENYMRLKKIMDSLKENYEIMYVNDGSKDSTMNKVEKICEKDKRIKLVNFSRNFGHQCAISAGMELSAGDAIIVIDADLQDPPEVIPQMIDKWKDGYDVVYGKRLKRKGESFLKKFTAKIFYRLLRSITNIDIPVDTGDFRLIDRKVCDTLSSLPERNRYVRGLVSWVGFKQTFVEFTRQERFAGASKYPLKKMLKLAFDGITSFSYKPLVASTYLGGLMFLLGLLAFIYVTAKNLYSHKTILTLGLILAINLCMFGLIFIILGILGQYIGRISDESKARPNYIIASTINYKENIKEVEPSEVKLN
ncbi:MULTISPECIES: glycosyltransferase family 2 protein [Clostridium]|uniref:Glycosyltransferase involved in cell wall biogenesis n=1 Tax=Clostridium acetobutylicum (strain ATCC 824 / DSM 792 / JCM 1419 / IAM 19013 / LMG 5710 / NBRC 13948 / NRRL B-527 / VKM B-1787 / 2291 / W) TaxID=272562 RepID=Q97MK2_CLOAB|nr:MULTISPECIES: glycosyltransferase [Clostridium]AAK78176.1 Glycosyltransferase involved in cell wall biogenesis [Clostridium acetobutylicum ATCC 824]ADZ19240.1 Glycosyltransferase [Clostridium acetobutylicum EA 2018]AEI34658.1 cell wall biosynthesis glycosyltransferase [Clostridium acetobutylicum DSM 1731]AWV81983.1 glycosyltransferase [Clostridium acetobutylicum]MBC2395948.1 glycosyltransferase family 2 protein [Clostridium acetobutylicum]